MTRTRLPNKFLKDRSEENIKKCSKQRIYCVSLLRNLNRAILEVLNGKISMIAKHFEKLLSTLYKISVGRKLSFVLKWNIIFFFRHSFSLSNRKTNFQSQFWFSIKLKNEFLFVFLRIFFCAQALLWSVTSPKLPLKNESSHLFSIFKKIENKIKILIIF